MALSAVPASDSSPAKPSLVIGIVPVELLTAPPAACPNPFATLDASPFRARQQARVAAAMVPDAQRLLQAATREAASSSTSVSRRTTDSRCARSPNKW